MAAIAAGWLLWHFLGGRPFDWALFLNTLKGLRWGWLLVAAAFGMTSYLGRALRWTVLIAPVRSNPSLWNLFSATAIGFTAITLLGRPGEFVRPYLIATREKVSLSSQLAALMLERIFDLLAALLVFGLALSRIHHSEVRAGPALTWVLAAGGYVAAAVALVTILVLVLIREYSATMRTRMLAGLRVLPERHYARAERFIGAFVEGVESTRSWRSLLLLCAYTAIEWILIVGTVWGVLLAFPALHFRIGDVLIFVGFIAFGAVVQIPGIGGGFQVVAVLVLTELFGMKLEAATGVAMLLWLVTFVVIVPVGLVLALREGVTWLKLKELGREVSP